MEQNPYLPPAAPNEPPRGPGGGFGYPSQYPFKHLGWKTTLTMIGLAASSTGSLAEHLLTPLIQTESPNLAVAFVVGLLGIGAGLASLATAVLFIIWMYAAAANVRAFGCELLRHSPGWAVAWWFIPFANIWMPFAVMSEIWRASDVSARRVSTTEWTKLSSGVTVKLWWAAYQLSGFVAVASVIPMVFAIVDAVNRHGEMPAAPHPNFWIGLLAQLLSCAAALCAIFVFREITRRQDEMALQMGITSV